MNKKAEKHSSSLIKKLLNERDVKQTGRVSARMLLASKIDDELKARNWSKKRFADEMGKRPSVVTKWLSGTHNFTVDTLVDIESKLGILLLDVTLEHKEIVEEYIPILVSEPVSKDFSEEMLWSSLINLSFHNSVYSDVSVN